MTAATVPDFGPLAGLKVVYAGSHLAGPFAAELMAEFGADVLWVESALTSDFLRTSSPWTFEMERRNQRTIALDLSTDDGAEVLLKLLADADVFIESSKGGQYRRWGLSDEVLWRANPALVITHVSGYGQDGDPAYVGRASFDPIAQAFGCYLQHNGPPEEALPAIPYTADYLTGLFGCFATLAAVWRSRDTGEGESIDVAMYEVLLRTGGPGPMAFLNAGVEPHRKPTRLAYGAGTGMMRCGDGEEVFVVLRGARVLERALPLLELEYGGALFPPGTSIVAVDSPGGVMLDRAIDAFCAGRSAVEVERALGDVGVACSRVYSYADAVSDPHYQARAVFTEWEAANGEVLHGVSIVPRLQRRPGRIWRPSPGVGTDSVEILESLGYSLDDVARLVGSGAVRPPEV